jgi:hypothetical protein
VSLAKQEKIMVFRSLTRVIVIGAINMLIGGGMLLISFSGSSAAMKRAHSSPDLRQPNSQDKQAHLLDRQQIATAEGKKGQSTTVHNTPSSSPIISSNFASANRHTPQAGGLPRIPLQTKYACAFGPAAIAYGGFSTFLTVMYAKGINSDEPNYSPFTYEELTGITASFSAVSFAAGGALTSLCGYRLYKANR